MAVIIPHSSITIAKINEEACGKKFAAYYCPDLYPLSTCSDRYFCLFCLKKLSHYRHFLKFSIRAFHVSPRLIMFGKFKNQYDQQCPENNTRSDENK